MKSRMKDWLVRIAVWSVILFVVYAVFRACTGMGPLWLLWAFPVVFFVAILTIGSINTRAAKADTRPLDDECDPEPLLIFSKAMYEKAGPIAASVTHRVNYSVALSLLGRDEEAGKSMRETAVLLPQKEDDENEIYYRLHEMNMRLSDMDATEFEQKLGALKDVVERAKLITERKAQFLRMLTELDYDFQIAGGTANEKTESDLRLLLTKAPTRYKQILYHARLGRYYRNKGEISAARPHWEFVAEHGNKLAIRAKAEELLKTL